MFRYAFFAGIAVCGLCLIPDTARALDCSGLPTSFTGNEFPNGDFFNNLNNSCYTISLGHGYGFSKYGDLNAVYFQMYFKVDPRYQLILVGTFPNTRYFSGALYDAHSALTRSIPDTRITPLTSAFTNPYLPGRPFADGQRFAIPIDLAGPPARSRRSA